MTIKLVDSHAHLDSAKLRDNIDELILRAKQVGVERIVTIGASRGLESNYHALSIAQAHSNIWCTAGIHPHDAAIATDDMIDTIAHEFARRDEVVGIGETGLDFHYDYAPKDVQEKVFRRFIQIAKDVNKPVIIHSRNADEDTVRILRDEGITGGILHCFTGSRKMAEQVLELDFYISFSGIVTFKNGKELLDIATMVPDERILVETDAPFLAPIPYRGKTNQPAYVRHTAETIAAARGITLQELSDYIWHNSSRVYHLP